MKCLVVIYWIPKTTINCKLYFLSNIPTNLFNVYNANFKYTKKYAKHFLYFICFYDMLNFNPTNQFRLLKPVVFIFPKKNKSITLLRAPFRHKLSKKNYILTRYKSLVSYTLLLQNGLTIKNQCQLIHIIKLINKYNYWFETNIQYLNKVTINIQCFLKKYKL